MQSNNSFFFFRSSESSLPWGAMLNFQWPVWEGDNTKFNTPDPMHTWDLVTLTSHMDTGEKMANWAQFGHFHLRVYSLLWPAV